MKRIVLTVFGLLALPALALAQTPTCPDCQLGIFDDPQLNKNFGTTTNFMAKDIYVGVILGAGRTGVTGVEFSITGLTDSDGLLVTNTEGVTEPAPNIIIGSPPAPADTTTGAGGCNATWASCVVGSGRLALLKVSLLPISPAPNHVLRVSHKFPVSNPNYGFSPIFTECDPPLFTAYKVPVGCYVINWDGVTDPAACPLYIPVQPQTWTGIKKLYN